MPSYTFPGNHGVTVKNLTKGFNEVKSDPSEMEYTKITFDNITIEKEGLRVRVCRSGKLLAEVYAGKYVLPKSKVEIHFAKSPSGNFVKKPVGKAMKVYLGPVCKAEIHEGSYELGDIRFKV